MNPLVFIKNTITKDTIYKMKLLATEQDKIADKVFEFRVNKELIQLSNNQVNFLNRKKIYTDASQRKLYEWPKGT